MPVFVAYGAAIRLGSTPIYSMIVACLLIHPDIIGMLSAEEPLKILGFTAYSASYASSFLPAILSTVAVANIEKLLNKYLPGMFKGIFVGGLTLVLASLLTLTVLGPIGFFAGEYFINFLVWMQMHDWSICAWSSRWCIAICNNVRNAYCFWPCNDAKYCHH